MKVKLCSVVLLISMAFTTLSAIEVNAVYYTKGKPFPTKVEIDLPNTWMVKASSTPQKMGDYLITKKRSVYMNLTLSHWPGYTQKKYDAINTDNGYTNHSVNEKNIFTKEITKTRKRVNMGSFISTPKPISLDATLSLYDDYLDKNVGVELQEAIAILASVKVLRLPDTEAIVDPKIASSKKNADDALAKLKHDALEGKSDDFPRNCAKVDPYLLKYTYPDAPQEVRDYYQNSKHLCYGKLHTLALQEKLKQEGKNVCTKMEVTLQINHIKSYIEKTNDIAIWDKFMLDYKQVCPNNLNF